MGLAKWHKAGPLSVLVVILVVGLMSPAGATVSGDNGKIAFVTDRDGNREIYSMDADGSNLINLTNHPADDVSPNWSPDGRRIVFVSDRNGISEIFVMNADGTNQARLAAGTGPSWSPDGTQIAFARDGDIYVMKSDGTGVRRITDSSAATVPEWATGATDHTPAWSPEGSRIAFLRVVHGPTPLSAFSELRILALPGGGGTTHLADLGSSASAPDWSPDGSEIAVGDQDLVPGSRVVILRVDGTGQRSLLPPEGMDLNTEPAWSPDGTLIATTAGKINVIPTEVFVSKADGSGNPKNLTNNPAHDGDPAWQSLNPYAVGLVDPATGIWRLRHESGAVDTFYYGNPDDTPFMGDWDCDGVDTPGLYRRSDGFVYLRNSNTQGVADTRFFFGNPGDMPIAGDFDGDGCDTVSIYRPSDARFHIINELGSEDTGLGYAEYSFIFGNPGDKPFVGDFDGDSVDEVGLHRESTGRVYFRNTLTQGVADHDFIFGNPGDRIISGDWNDKGIDSPALFRPNNTTFSFRFTNTTGTADAQFIWGDNTWLPVSGNFAP